MKQIFSDDDIFYMKEHYLEYSYKEIANTLGFTERQVRGKINNMGLTKVRKINDHYFDIIDTPLKAYFLGYIFANGWIIYSPQRRNYEFGMSLQSKDKYILEKINTELGGLNDIKHIKPRDKIINGNIAHSKSQDCLRIYSKNIVLGLMNNGIVENKSTKDDYPIVSDDLFFDFLRGYIDGDGCFYKYKKYYYLHITCGSNKILKYIQNKLLSYGIVTHLYKEKDKKYRLMCVNIDEMSKLIPLLYYNNDVFCLLRKKQRIESYLGSAA